MSGHPLRVAAYGYFGIGNLGNEASLAAFLEYLRAAHPDISVSCLAVGAAQVRREHGIPATQLMSYRSDAASGGMRLTARKILGRLWDIPRTFRLIGDVDVAVVPGSGVFETGLAIPPWGLPYWLFLLAIGCRLRGRKLVLLSVGAQEPTHPVTRFFNRWTVRLASYCSCRDEGSAAALHAVGVRGPLGGLFPDLVFGATRPTDSEVVPGEIAIGVMAYYGSPGNPERGPGVRRDYERRMAYLVTRLNQSGRSVTLVIGDEADREVALEIAALARAGAPAGTTAAVQVSPARTMAEVMAQISCAEVVLASRFHNLIAALKLAKPTVSLGYGPKNAELLSTFGLHGYAQDLDDFDLDALLDQVDEVSRAQPDRTSYMQQTLQRFEAELDRQFRTVSDRFFVAAH